LQRCLTRNESCGGHFREEYQSPGEAMEMMKILLTLLLGRKPSEAVLKNQVYENVKLVTRSYK
jgi:succinate dehydrogenase / fumarate reductase flavoprotein subunit